MTAAPRLRFLEEYGAIRRAEGRGSEDSAYYQALPYSDLTGKNSGQWRIRARTFDYFVRDILPRMPCDILDLGAGNCWFSNRVAQLGHRPVAVDIFGDPLDGLGAARHYQTRFPVIEAEFDRLPLLDKSFDFAVFNASIHYSSDYRRTLSEARRCVRPGGKIVILDSPVYRRAEHGIQMREERHRSFEKVYGFRSDALGSIEFFDEEMLAELARSLSIKWEIHRPWCGWQWHLRPLKARLLRRRPPSRFWILDARV